MPSGSERFQSFNPDEELAAESSPSNTSVGTNAFRLMLCLCLFFIWQFTDLSFAQAQQSNQHSSQSSTDAPVLRVQSRLVVIRVIVIDKKTWRNGASKAEEKCLLASEEKFYRLALSEPYEPPDCQGLYVRGLTRNDFHLLIDGQQQEIQSVTSANEGLRIRDNFGEHYEFSQTPDGIWSTQDHPGPHYISEGTLDYGIAAQNRYDLSFIPRGPGAVGCHKIKVEVDRRNSIVAARKEYCASQSPTDILNGSALGAQLEKDLLSDIPPEIPLALQAAVFRDTDGMSRVRIALGFSADLLQRHWASNGTLEATIGVLGTIQRRDGTLAHRISDFACCTPFANGFVFGMQGMNLDSFTNFNREVGLPANLISKILDPIEKSRLPTRYETQFDLLPGDYDLRIVLSDGEKFGRAVARIDKYDPEQLSVSSVMLCNRYRDARVAELERKAANFAPQYVPMTSKGVQVSPTGHTSFSPDDGLVAYFEIYKPLTADPESDLQAHVRIVEAKSAQVVKDFPVFSAAEYEQTGMRVVPIAREIPLGNLSAGAYRLEVQASDASGRRTQWSTTDFSIK